VTITLTFNPEVEAGLLVKAQARGMELQDYLQSLVERDLLPPSQKTTAAEAVPREEAVRRMIAFGDTYHLSLGQPITRDVLHEGHRF
jgi:hypothetical protein